jgi:hypothetical protein
MIRLIVLARKPLNEKSVAENVLKHDCGGLNIDATRIGTEQRTYTGSGNSPQKTKNRVKGDTGVGLLDGRGRDLEFKVAGRWPSNLILQHKEGCRKVGTSEINGHKGYPQGPGGSDSGKSWSSSEVSSTLHKRRGVWSSPANNPDGTETIDQWECVDSCPVKDLGGQSGIRPGWRTQQHSNFNPYGGNALNPSATTRSGVHQGFDDIGTAARFFKQVGGRK